jgi:hypothetical protein
MCLTPPIAHAIGGMARGQLTQHSIFVLISILVSFLNTNYGFFCKLFRRLLASLKMTKMPHQSTASQQPSHDVLAKPSTEVKNDMFNVDSEHGHSLDIAESDVSSAESDQDSLENGFVIEVAIHEPRVVRINEVPLYAKRRSKCRTLSSADRSVRTLIIRYVLMVIKVCLLFCQKVYVFSVSPGLDSC